MTQPFMTLSLRRCVILPLMLATALTLSACQSAEEKAEGYYQSGLALLEAGDQERALIEFRNTFKYNGFHKEARQTYADILVKQGKTAEAYSQYLRLIEQYPDTLDVRLTLAAMAIDAQNWEEVERHAKAAIALAPQESRTLAMQILLDYRTAVLNGTDADRDRVAAAASSFLQALPADAPASLAASVIARRVVIDRLVTLGDLDGALPQLEQAIAQNPQSLEYQMLKFRILVQKNDIPATGAQLQRMFELFPEDQEVKTSLIQWYMVQNDLDGAEAFLRKLAGEVTGAPEGHLALVQFLQVARNPQAALQELDALIAANAATPNGELYASLRATLEFEDGKTTQAIAAIEAILAKAAPSDQTRRIKGMLARMLDSTENRVGARALVEEILAEDATNTEALKLRAAWFISEDKPGEAILDLRAALDQNPRDSETLTLMAAAHERDGALDLAGERLALAVEVSGAAADESLRYANFLMRQNKPEVAETVLIDARRTSPNDGNVLGALSEYYVSQSLWTRAQETLDVLKSLNQPENAAAVQSLQAAILAGEQGMENSLAFLKAQALAGNSTANAVASIVDVKLRAGQTAEARSYLDDALKATPEDSSLQLISANLDALMGKTDLAEAQYRALIAKDATAETPARQLYALLQKAGRTDEATTVLDTAISVQPNSATLLWIKAGALELAGDVKGAIAIYDQLYIQDSSNQVVANNLASLITTYYDDAENLKRAEAISRRLRESPVPAFQDTYGWIAFRNGNLEEALAHLEPAALGLPQEPSVQYHLGMTYAALERTADAIRQLELALRLAGDKPLPQAEAIGQELVRLKALPATPAPANP
jgi:predicted Zn-dependent protease